MQVIEVGTHELIEIKDPYHPQCPKTNWTYYKCSTCGIILYYLSEEFVVSRINGSYPQNPLKISCDDFIIGEIIV